MPRFSLRRSFGSGGSFNGTDNYVMTTYTTAIGSGGFTYSVWIKSSAVNGIYPIISKRKGTQSPANTNYQQFSLYISGNIGGSVNGNKLDINYVQNTGVADRSVLGTTNVLDGKWHHAVAVVTGTASRIYLDGQLEPISVSSSNGASVNITRTDNLAIGQFTNGGSNILGSPYYFPGQIDDVRIFNSALTATQVLQLYNQSSSGYDPIGSPAGWWKFDENTGSSVADASVNANTGTWNGTLGSQWTTGVTFTQRSAAIGRTTALGLRPLVSRSSNNTAANFTGSTKLTKSDTATLKSNGTDFSFFQWTFMTSNPAQQGWACKDQNGAGVSREWHTQLKTNGANANKTDFIIRTIDNAGNALITKTVSALSLLNTWHLLGFTYNFSTRVLTPYVDGVAQSPGTATGDISASTGQFALGSMFGTGNYNGFLQSSGFWQKLLTAAEVTYLYNNGKALRWVDVQNHPTLPTSLGGWWDLGESSGTRNDSSANGNNLTDSGSTGSTGGNVAVARTLVT